MFVRQYFLLAFSAHQACGYTTDPPATTPIETSTTTPLHTTSPVPTTTTAPPATTPIGTSTTTPLHTTTPVPTTTLRNCVDYICPVNYANKPNPLSEHCLDPRGCSPHDCCLIITTTPVPTTTPLTCATFACPPPSVWPAIPNSVTCHGQCTKAVCCLDPTTTPVPTTPVPGNTAYGRKYSEQQDAMVRTVVAAKKETNTHTWIMFALLATGVFAVMAGASVYRTRQRNTRRFVCSKCFLMLLAC